MHIASVTYGVAEGGVADTWLLHMNADSSLTAHRHSRNKRAAHAHLPPQQQAMQQAGACLELRVHGVVCLELRVHGVGCLELHVHGREGADAKAHADVQQVTLVTCLLILGVQ